MHWKDFFYTGTTERRGIIVLIILIMAVLFAPWFIKITDRGKEADFSEFEKAVAEFENQQAQMMKKSGKNTSRALTPFEFDPNTLSQQGWEQMGVAAHISRSVENYLKAGGIFRYREDLEKIYLIDNELYEVLLPFINLPAKPAIKAPKPHASPQVDNLPVNKDNTPALLMIDINLTDAALLQQLRGIGPVFSTRIVAYREKLGGFHNINQLSEVYGMDSIRLAGIMPHLTTGDSELRKLDVNLATLDELFSHPYINYNVANSVIAMRNIHGYFLSLENLLESKLVDEDLFKKISPYLKISPPKPAEQEHIAD